MSLSWYIYANKNQKCISRFLKVWQILVKYNIYTTHFPFALSLIHIQNIFKNSRRLNLFVMIINQLIMGNNAQFLK